MESKDLLHLENDENQNQMVNSGSSSEDQNNTEIQEEIMETTPEVIEELPAKEEIVETTSEVIETTPEVIEELPVKEEVIETTSEVTEKLPEETVVETVPEVVEKTDAPQTDESVSDMMKDIENQTSIQEEVDIHEEDDDADTETEQEDSIEKIESDYAQFGLNEAVTALSQVVVEENYNKIKQRVGVLKAKILQQLKEFKQEQLAKFLAEGGNKEEYEPEISEEEKSFNAALQIFRANKNRFLEEVEAQKQKNLKAKQAIIDHLRELVESETELKVLNDKFKQYQEEWKEIGPVPQNESGNLWQNYHFYVEKFFDILRINKELRSLDLKKNLEQKISLCEKAESLLLQESINRSFKELQQLHNEWKEIGPVPEDKKEEIWERFKNATTQINSSRREYYDKIYTEQQNNYNAKLVLCEQAEELVSEEIQSIKKFNDISDRLTDLLKVWKTLGPAPTKLNDDIWSRFKQVLDKFFQSKKEFFDQLKDAQMQNYNLKLNLAIRAEALAARTDWKQATDEMLALQGEWREIGAIPRKHAESLWKRFRGACDTFFETKSKYFSNIHEIEAENLVKKEELIKSITEYEFGSDKNENLETMKRLQREWTEIGHVPKKDKDRVYQAYRDAINKRFADLKMTVEDVRRDSYKSKIDTILNNPDADKVLDKEKRFLITKMNQIKEDIILWENNLGFFANSKNADVLKAEFVKKIEKAKEEVKGLEYKVRMMKTEQRLSKEETAKKTEANKESDTPEQSTEA